MNGANHNMLGISTYPFDLFGNGWEKNKQDIDQFPNKGNTKIGNDVWIGQNVTFLPGVNVGNGVIIGANTVVTKDIPAYAVVGGNPGTFIRKRFTADIIDELEKLAWWDREIEWITKNIPLLIRHDSTIEAIRKLSM
ncbi:virginiamycin A acetyltransferase [Enterococcus sp. AZ126]